MRFGILDCEKNSREWINKIKLLNSNCQDIYYFPQYYSLQLTMNGSKGLMFFYENGNNIWLHTFIKSKIKKHLFEMDGVEYFDLESAYGYAGPLCNTKDQIFKKKANGKFNEWCAENNIIAGFYRFHPLLKNHDLFDDDYEIIYDRNTLAQEIHLFDFKYSYSAKVRNMINRCKREGVKIDCFNPRDFFDKFKALYIKNMTRINAEKYYFFNNKYFSKLSKIVQNEGYLIGAVYKDSWAGSSIFLKGGDNLHYHLSASDRSLNIPGVVNAIIHKAILIAKENNLNILHLGGGNSNSKEDNLYKFKKKMANQEHKFYIARKIYKKSTYLKIKKQWSKKYPELVEKHKSKILFYKYIY